MRLYGHISRINTQRIPKKVLNMKLKGKQPRGKLKSRQQERKDVTQRERRPWEETEEEL
jgi:hypothetical protein